MSKNTAKAAKTNTNVETKETKDKNSSAKNDASNSKNSQVVKAKENVRKIEKIEWTLERCKKYARRYPNESLWASGSPASYKSAVAHGWRDVCLTEMQMNPHPFQQAPAGQVIQANFGGKNVNVATTTNRRISGGKSGKGGNVGGGGSSFPNTGVKKAA